MRWFSFEVSSGVFFSPNFIALHPESAQLPLHSLPLIRTPFTLNISTHLFLCLLHYVHLYLSLYDRLTLIRSPNNEPTRLFLPPFFPLSNSLRNLCLPSRYVLRKFVASRTAKVAIFHPRFSPKDK